MNEASNEPLRVVLPEHQLDVADAGTVRDVVDQHALLSLLEVGHESGVIAGELGGGARRPWRTGPTS